MTDWKLEHSKLYEEFLFQDALIQSKNQEICTLSDKLALTIKHLELLKQVENAGRNLLDAYDESHWRDPERDLEYILNVIDGKIQPKRTITSGWPGDL